MKNATEKLSVAIITCNEEPVIESTLKSVRWADEIVVVDSGSTDRTTEICKRYTDRLYQEKWRGYAEQREYVISLTKNRWVLMLDADEVIPRQLADEIKETFRNGPDCDGYLISRKNHFLGRWLPHCGWYPDYQLKLFRKDTVWINPVLVHEGAFSTGKVGKLKGSIYHYTVRSIRQYFDRFDRYTSLEVMSRARKRKKISLAYLFFEPLYHFYKVFILRKGFLDGLEGFLASAFSSFYRLVAYAKVWEHKIMNP